jgi:hypothetical protein
MTLLRFEPIHHRDHGSGVAEKFGRDAVGTQFDAVAAARIPPAGEAEQRPSEHPDRYLRFRPRRRVLVSDLALKSRWACGERPSGSPQPASPAEPARVRGPLGAVSQLYSNGDSSVGTQALQQLFQWLNATVCTTAKNPAAKAKVWRARVP